jgi:hypothetical protein
VRLTTDGVDRVGLHEVDLEPVGRSYLAVWIGAATHHHR